MMSRSQAPYRQSMRWWCWLLVLLDLIPLLERSIVHSNDPHDRLVRAIRRGQPIAARAAMEEHLAGTALLRGFLS
ncbi:MAG: GntR-family transcriptional regulator [Frankiales bacterium]|jgi:DNA-binding GntR family transcriptional regulator|nr:GntR-family transcriptional regulator [Frankiales bacterium]